MPSRLASGAKISRVSRAMRSCFSGRTCIRVRMLCSRSASLISTTRTSSLIARNVLRRLSVWRSMGVLPSLDTRGSCASLVTPSTRRATSSPKSSRMSSRVRAVSSTVSCSKPAARAAAAGLSHVLIKVAERTYGYGLDWHGQDLVAPVAKALRARGIQVWGWHYVYGEQPVEEARAAVKRANQLGLDGYVIDAEGEYTQPGRAAAAHAFMTHLKSGLPA